jgi:hypothetical protein
MFYLLLNGAFCSCHDCQMCIDAAISSKAVEQCSCTRQFLDSSRAERFSGFSVFGSRVRQP